MRKIISLVLLTGLPLLAACNTVAGAGEDLQSAGSAVEDAAD